MPIMCFGDCLTVEQRREMLISQRTGGVCAHPETPSRCEQRRTVPACVLVPTPTSRDVAWCPFQRHSR